VFFQRPNDGVDISGHLAGPVALHGRAEYAHDSYVIDNLSAQTIIVARIEAEILWLSLRWLRTLDDDRFDRLGQQEMIIDISRGNDDRQWSSLTINQQAFFEPCLARSVGLGPILSPPLRALPSAPSAACHCQSTSPNSSHSARSKDQIISNSPCSIQRWKV
jgi:hypothetical protein